MNKLLRGFILVSILSIAFFVRYPLLSTTCGSDIPQFAGFLKTFTDHGFCFYLYNDPTMAGTSWPYPWRYVYGPPLLFLLNIVGAISKPIVKTFESEGMYHVYVSSNWCASLKFIFSLFDLGNALLVYFYLTRIANKGYIIGYIAAMLHLFHPIIIYISSIYGMFDSITTFFFMLGLYIYKRYRNIIGDILGLFIIGFSIAIKPTLLVSSIILMIYIIVRCRNNKKRMLISIISALLGFIISFIPFIVLCPSSINMIIDSLLESSKSNYVSIIYSFNGFSSIATYAHDKTRINYLYLINNWWIPFTILFSIIVILTVFSNDLDQYIFTGYIVFLATFWRVNPQYLYALICLVILMIFTLRKVEIVPKLITIYILPALWTMAFPLSFWGYNHIENPNRNIVTFLERISLNIYDELFYVILALIFTITMYFIIIDIIVWRIHDILVSRKKSVRCFASIY